MTLYEKLLQMARELYPDSLPGEVLPLSKVQIQVTSITYGVGYLRKISCEESVWFPIEIHFKSGHFATFTRDGRENYFAIWPDLAIGEFRGQEEILKEIKSQNFDMEQ